MLHVEVSDSSEYTLITMISAVLHHQTGGVVEQSHFTSMWLLV